MHAQENKYKSKKFVILIKVKATPKAYICKCI